MLWPIVRGCKEIISLLMKRGEARKVKLETKKLRDELADKERRIVPATLADVKEFDPKYNQIKAQMQPKAQKSTLEKKRFADYLRTMLVGLGFLFFGLYVMKWALRALEIILRK